MLFPPPPTPAIELNLADRELFYMGGGSGNMWRNKSHFQMGSSSILPLPIGSCLAGCNCPQFSTANHPPALY